MRNNRSVALKAIVTRNLLADAHVGLSFSDYYRNRKYYVQVGL